MAYEPPTDAPGQDCPDHGPYADDDCPKCGRSRLRLTTEDLRRDALARAWSRRKLEQIIQAADASAESYRSKL